MEELQNLHNQESTDNSYEHVLKYTGIFGGVQGLKMLVSILRTKLTTVLLGSTGFGLISVYNSISEFIVSCSNFGVPLNATRVTSELFENGTNHEIQHKVRMIRTWVLWTALFAVAVTIALSPVLSYFFFDHEWNHILEVVLICPIVVALLIAEGECSILKGLRQLRKIAFIETIAALTTLLSTIPFYYIWGIHGIIVALIVSTCIAAALHLYFSVQLVHYKVSLFSMDIFREGLPMIRQGIPYVLAGIANSGVGMLIPAMILTMATLSDLGFYRAGTTLMVGYAGMAFVALENDYYPRLSSVNHDVVRMNKTINQQIDVCVLLITPFVILYILCMPLIVNLLYKPEFLVVVDMTVFACFYLFLRAIMLPISYTALAKGDSVIFLIMEVLYDIIFGCLMWFLYKEWGLKGAGIALSLGAVYDLVSVTFIYGWKYGCRISKHTVKLCVFQFICLFAVFEACLQSSLLFKIGVGSMAFIISAYTSFRFLYKKKASR